MLVNFNPAITNNRAKQPCFKGLVNIEKVSRFNHDAEFLESCIAFRNLKLSEADIADIDKAIEIATSKGRKGAAFILNRIKESLNIPANQ